MKRRIDFLVMALFAVLLLTSCERVAPNYAGVLMENFGKQGKEDFNEKKAFIQCRKKFWVFNV